MNYQHLEYFLKAAEYQHYTRAAEELHITQPALTKAILGIEKELGAPMFIKQGRNMKLSKYGEIFFEYVKRSLDEINCGISAVKHQINDDLNTVTLSALCSSDMDFFREKVAVFRQIHPNCNLNITFKYTSAIIEDVSNHTSIIGLCGEFGDASAYPHLEKRVVYTKPIHFVVNSSHPFAHRTSVDVSELKDEPFAIYNMSSNGTNKLLFEICTSSGFSPRLLTEVYNDYGMINEVLSNRCTAIVSHTFFEHFKSLGFVELHLNTNFPLLYNINLIWLKDAELPALAKDFCRILLGE